MITSANINLAHSIFRKHGGTLRTREALAAGIHPRTLYAMRDAGLLMLLARGLYRLADMPPLSNPDLATVGKCVPQGVLCLISALAFHELTTQIPHVVHLALPRNSRTPRLNYPPIQVYRFSKEAFKAGIEVHTIESIDVRAYSAEKTLADCFKYRNKVGLEVTLDALGTYRRRRGAKLQCILEHARICRVESVIRPYLEANL
jgi:predicted transcriptional regulator of viral defense system